MKYWKETVFFGLIFGYFMFGLTTDCTWMNLGSDMFSYVGSAEYMEPAILAGYPMWMLLAWPFVHMPGNPFWWGAVLSALCSLGVSIFVFLTIKGFTPNKWAPYFGALVYAGSFIVWTQSTIPEVYTPTLLVMIGGTYFTLKHRFYWATFVFALGLGLHPIVTFAIFPCLIYTYYQKNKDWRFILRVTAFGCLGFLAYLQMIFSDSSADNGLAESGMTVWDILQIVGALPLVPFSSTLDRWYEFALVGGLSFGFTIPLYLYLKKSKEVVLVAAIGLAVLSLYMFSLLPQWVTYLTFVTAFLAVLAGWGLARVPYKWATPMFLLIPVILMANNMITYDLNRNVDESPTTARQFYHILDEVEDGSIMITSAWAHPGLITEYHNLKEDNDIALMRYAKVYWNDRYKTYIENLEDEGVVVPPVFEEADQPKMNENFEEWCHLVAELNPDRRVYVAYMEREDPMFFNLTDASTYSNSINSCWDRESPTAAR